MNKELLVELLAAVPGHKRDDDAFTFPEGGPVSVYIGTPGETLVVSRVTRARVYAQRVELATHKGDLSLFPTSSVCGVQVEAK